MKNGWQFFAFAIILTVSSVSAAANCKVCESDSDTKCIKEPDTFPDVACSTSKCFTSIDNKGNLKRGCLGADEKCEGSTCKECDASTTPTCNVQKDLFWCKTCESSVENDCAFWKNEISIPNLFCDSGVSKCFMEIKTDNHISRRCATKSDEVCPTDKKCEVCSSNSCNKGIFPSDRRQCYQCNSDNAKCASPTKNSDIVPFPCLFYEESDKCFEHGTSDTAMSRGCHSDTTAYGKCSSETGKCKECDSNGCNVDEYKIESNVSCIQCKSDDVKCAGTHTAEEAKKCDNKIEYWKLPGCYTNKIGDGKIDKGCIQDIDCAATATCTSCTNGTACNTAETGTTCITCRSDDDPACADDAIDKTKFPPTPCRNPTTPDANGEQCFTDRWREGGNIVIRACTSDADAKTRKDCLDPNYKYCDSCKGNDCNVGKAPNSAHSIAVASGLLAISLLVLKFF